MKFLIMAVAAAAIKVSADPEDEWLEIPKFTESTKDAHDQWGHEVQRAGHKDWLDHHVEWKDGNDNHASALAGPNAIENRVAIADS